MITIDPDRPDRRQVSLIEAPTSAVWNLTHRKTGESPVGKKKNARGNTFDIYIDYHGLYKSPISWEYMHIYIYIIIGYIIN